MARPLTLTRYIVLIGQLKTSLASIIALTLAITFLAAIQEGEEPQAVLLKGIAVAAVIAVLVFFSRAGEKDQH